MKNYSKLESLSQYRLKNPNINPLDFDTFDSQYLNIISELVDEPEFIEEVKDSLISIELIAIKKLISQG